MTDIINAVVKYYLVASIHLNIIDELQDSHLNTQQVKFHSKNLSKIFSGKKFADAYKQFYSTPEKESDAQDITQAYGEIVELISWIPLEYLPSMAKGIRDAINGSPELAKLRTEYVMKRDFGNEKD